MQQSSQQPQTQPQQSQHIIQHKYKIIKKIGEGNFGSVYRGIKITTNDPVAIKFEHANTPVKILKHETTILNYLYSHGSRYTPIVYWYGIYKTYTCLIMPLYQYPLDTYFYQVCKGSQPHLNKLMAQCIDILETIHTHYVVHRDIKPQNFMIGNDGQLYLIDFGFSTFFVDEHNQHIKNDCIKENIVGTAKYVSYFVHSGHEHVRRDDLIGIGYMYIYLITSGKLPWNQLMDIENIDFECVDGIHPVTHIEHYKNKLMKIKKSWTNFKSYCENIGGPIFTYMEYCYQLNFSHNPPYSALKKLFE
jgi:serine/threonine protein kinase